MFTVIRTPGNRYSIKKGKNLIDSNLKYELSNELELNKWLIGVEKNPRKKLDEMYEKKYSNKDIIKELNNLNLEDESEDIIPTEITLRGYQQTDINNIKSALNKNRGVLYSLPTGGGKSIILSSIIDENSDKNILILAHKRKLLLQLEDHLKRRGLKPGLIYAGVEKNLNSNILISSVRSIVNSKRLDMISKRKWDYVIIDEARHSRTPTYDKVLEEMKKNNSKIKILGVDATPHRRDKKSLGEHFDELVLSIENMETLIEKKYLAEIKTFVSPIGDLASEVSETSSDYVLSDLSKYMRKPAYLNYLVASYDKFGENRQAIIFAVDINHATDIVDKFNESEEYNGLIAKIDSKMSNKEIDRVIKQFEDKEIQILVNVEMLTEGVDLPECACIIGARPTKSLSLYLQMAGRGTRPKQDGGNLLVLDCCGWTGEYGKVSSKRRWSLNENIDPDIERKNNRVVPVNSTGEITDTTLDGYMGEVEELSPEEYTEKLGDNIDLVKKENNRLNEESKKIILDSMKKMYQKLGIILPKNYIEEISIYGSSCEYTLSLKEEDQSEGNGGGLRRKSNMGLRIEKQIAYRANTSYLFAQNRTYLGQRNDLKDYGNFQIISGKINKALFEDEALENDLEMAFDLAEELSSKKRDIHALEQKKRAEEITQTIEKINIALKLGKLDKIEFEEGIYASNHLRGEYGHFFAISFPDKKIKKNQNKVIFYHEDGRTKTIRTSISEEKIKDIIKDGKYKI